MTKLKQIFRHQTWNLLYLLILILGLILCLHKSDNILAGKFLNLTTETWFWIAIIIPILHQFYVLVIWRIELVTHHFTKKYGLKKSFKFFGFGFFIVFIARLVALLIVAISNRNTLIINHFVSYLLVAIITPVVIYLFYSVAKYFTFRRALGLDHFDENYCEPYEKRGIYKYVNNGMYIYGLLILYLPGLIFFSKAAILVALFNYIYIWGHYFTLERPDMAIIYGKTPK